MGDPAEIGPPPYCHRPDCNSEAEAMSIKIREQFEQS
jgi:hypothetical protein